VTQATLQALDAERSVLGAMLLDPDAAVSVLARVNSDVFAEPRHGRIFSAMRELHDKGRSSDLVSLTEHLNAQGLLDSVGGASYLSELLGCVATAAHIENHVELVKEAWSRRRMVRVGTDIVREAESGIPAAEVIGNAQNAVFQVAREKGSSGYVSSHRAVGTAIAELEAIHGTDKEVTGVPTGLTQLDSLLLGLHGGDLVVLAARPSMGKTALALGAARYAAGSGCVVGFFSL